MENITIQEEYTLPSLGQIYQTKFDPQIKLRSMTVAEEMKRLTATQSPYKSMSDIIDACILNKLPISAYDMCIGDYQYLLHKLRTVTYGADYSISIACPYCGNQFVHTIDLDSLKVNTFDGEMDTTITLPKSGDVIEIKFQTPRDLDNIDRKKRELKKQFPDMVDDPTLMLNIESMIKTINGQPKNAATIQQYIKKLPLMDSSLILSKAEKLNRKVGVDIGITAHCDECDRDINTSFRFTSSFFRPEVDE